MQQPGLDDRIALTREPDSVPVMHQNWHHLLFLHWEVPPSELQALLPPGLDVDLFDGKAYAGLVPFTLTGVRPVLTPPLPWLSSFHEINVRTYVHRGGRDPGVWFFSLDASSSVAVAAARAAYSLPYFTSDIEFEASTDPLPTIEFRSRRVDDRGPLPANASIRYRPEEGETKPVAPGTLEHFLIERYLLYSTDSSARLHRARVHHQPYAVQRCEVEHLDETMVWAAGIRRPGSAPHRLYSKEVAVRVYAPEAC